MNKASSISPSPSESVKCSRKFEAFQKCYWQKRNNNYLNPTTLWSHQSMHSYWPLWISTQSSRIKRVLISKQAWCKTKDKLLRWWVGCFSVVFAAPGNKTEVVLWCEKHQLRSFWGVSRTHLSLILPSLFMHMWKLANTCSLYMVAWEVDYATENVLGIFQSSSAFIFLECDLLLFVSVCFEWQRKRERKRVFLHLCQKRKENMAKLEEKRREGINSGASQTQRAPGTMRFEVMSCMIISTV